MLRCSWLILCSPSVGTLASGRGRRVVACYRPQQIDLGAAALGLASHGAVIHCSYPLLPAPISSGGGAVAKLKKPAMPAVLKTDPELLCFSIPCGPALQPAGAATDEAGCSSSSSSSSSSGAGGAARRGTFVAFREGGVVGWSVEWDDVLRTRALLQSLGEAAQQLQQQQQGAAAGAVLPIVELPDEALAVDSMEFRHFAELSAEEQAGEAPCNFIDADSDVIVLADDSAANKVPFSYALAQSVKLDAVNAAMGPLAAQVRDWQRILAAHGHLRCSVKQLRQSKTHLLALVEHLNFRHNALATPRIFWSGDFQQLRGVYRDACDHLEIEERGEALRAKMETADESLSYLHDEVHASSNELLTWVIIWLIAFEVVLALGIFEAVTAPIKRLVRGEVQQ